MESFKSPNQWRRRTTPVRFRFVHRRSLIRRLINLICILLLVICGGRLVGYMRDYLAAERSTQALREAYYDTEDLPATETPVMTEVPAVTEAPADALPARVVVDIAPVAEEEAVPAETPAVLLAEVPYPHNASAIISDRFQRLRRQNSDIVGWITIDDLIDEAVVQRDNTYYLSRDYQGYHNQNGALFLDQYCDLDTRPYTLIIYGHNMKTGVRFGSLRNYEDSGFYRRNALFTFDTAYEEGRYVIFSVGSFSTNPESGKYLNFAELTSPTIELRRKAVRKLESLSIYHTHINVDYEDQIVLLVTCDGENDERRFVAARRIMPNEEESDLIELVSQSVRK